MKPKEIEMIVRAKRDPRAFGPLYQMHFDAIFGFIRLRVPDAPTAGDLTSQTFLKAMSHIRKFEIRGIAFRSWLFRIALNEVNGWWRKQKKVKELGISSDQLRSLVDETEEYLEDDRLERLIIQLNDLPEAHLALMELRFFEGRSFKELSEILGITENAAKMRVSRIVSTLRIAMGVEK
ncbi:MAG: sigma-70 family RNA polymerase sigma factor [Flavobacteriales bacterium]|nr:sigma-70 family RNA polymerase sigma factor [Flavobacteriales bacterium]